MDILSIIEQSWSDPVISKVIGGIILAIILSFIKGVRTVVVKFFIWIWNLITVRKDDDKQMDIAEPKELESEKLTNNTHPDVFFSYLIERAFPNQNNQVKVYDAKDAIKRLKFMFDKPVYFGDYDSSVNKFSDPVWWFRGTSSMPVRQIKFLGENKILMNWEELILKEIVVDNRNPYRFNIIYFDVLPDKSVWKKYSKEQIEKMKHGRSYVSESYGLFENKIIKHEEYDAGTAEIGGELIDVSGKAEIRYRKLSRYNFIICSKRSPYNDPKFDRFSEPLLDDVINRKILPEEFLEKARKFLKDK